MIVLDRRETPRGELVLRQVEDAFEIISNGVFLMDSRSGESERLLVSAPLQRLAAPRGVLIGGLGMGFSLREALRDRRIESVTVVEIEPAVIDWQRDQLAPCSGSALQDPRVQVHCGDLVDRLRTDDRSYDLICLDIDNGPQWTVVPENGRLYDVAGLESIRSRLRPGGAVSVWSAAAAPAFADRLAAIFERVDRIEVPVPRGEPDVVYLGMTA